MHSIEDVLEARSLDTRTAQKTVAGINHRVYPNDIVLPSQQTIDSIPSTRKAELDQGNLYLYEAGELTDIERLYYAEKKLGASLTQFFYFYYSKRH